MAYKVEILEIAELELDSAIAWYKEKNVAIATKFLNVYSSTRQSLSENPLLYSEIKSGIRRARFRNNFPYSVFYYLKKDTVIIVSIFHDKRNPMIWQSR